MRKAEIAELKALHQLVIHMDHDRHEQVFEAYYPNGWTDSSGHVWKFEDNATPFEIREDKLVKKAGEYELAAVCSECFPTHAQMVAEAAPYDVIPHCDRVTDREVTTNVQRRPKKQKG